MVSLINKCDFPSVATNGTVTTATSGGDAEDTAFTASSNPGTKKVPGLFGAACMHASLSAQIVSYLGWTKSAGAPLSTLTMTEAWASQYVNFGSARSPDTRIRSMVILNASSTQLMTVSYTTAGIVQLRNISSGATSTGTVALSLNTWYRVEMHTIIPSTGNTTNDVWVYDAATETLVDSITGWASTATAVAGLGGAWYGVINTASVTFSTGWDVDICRYSTDGLIGPYTPPSTVHAPYWGTPVV